VGSLPWIGLTVFVVAVIGGAVLAGVRGLAAYRVLRSFQRRLNVAVEETTRLIEGIEPRVAKASATAERLAEAQVRLQQSAASARVLFSALGEAVALVQRVAAFLPR
jgi:hypothetical protein